MWQIAKYYLRDDTRSLDNVPTRDLVSVVKFYTAEVKRYFRGNGEVNEASYRLEAENLSHIPARILIVDLLPMTGYSGIPDFLVARELILDRDFAIETAFSDSYPGSSFDSVDGMLNMLDGYLQHCEHIEFWLIIVRESEVEDELLKFLGGKRRRSRWFEFSVLSGGDFRYLIARRM